MGHNCQGFPVFCKAYGQKQVVAGKNVAIIIMNKSQPQVLPKNFWFDGEENNGIECSQRERMR